MIPSEHMSTEARQRLIAAAGRGLKATRERLESLAPIVVVAGDGPGYKATCRACDWTSSRHLLANLEQDRINHLRHEHPDSYEGRKYEGWEMTDE